MLEVSQIALSKNFRRAALAVLPRDVGQAAEGNVPADGGVWDCRENGVSGLTALGVSGQEGRIMTDTLVAVEPSDEHDDGIVEVPADRSVDELEVARELVRQAREAGVRLTGLRWVAQSDDENGARDGAR